MKIEIGVGLKLTDENYCGIDLKFPTKNPSEDTPFEFDIIQKKKKEDADKDGTKLLSVVVAGSDKIYVAVSPPENILKLAGDIVEELNVKVNEGDYNPSTGKFGDTGEGEAGDNTIKKIKNKK